MNKKYEEVYIVNDRASWLDVIAGCIVYLSLLGILVIVSAGTRAVIG